jgi:hypothetical protein
MLRDKVGRIAAIFLSAAIDHRECNCFLRKMIEERDLLRKRGNCWFIGLLID